MTASLDTATTTLEVMPATRTAVALALPDEKRIERIKAFHAGTLNAFADQMSYAFLAGVEFLSLKESTVHGQFEKLCADVLGEIPKRTRCQYMSFATVLIDKSATVALLAKEPLLLTNGKVAEADAVKICKAVHDIADGKTLTEMYRDLGVIRQAKKVADVDHHPKGKKLSLAEQAAQEMALARTDWQALQTQLAGYAARFILLEDIDVHSQISALETALAARRQWVDTPKKDRDAKKVERLFTQVNHKDTKGTKGRNGK